MGKKSKKQKLALQQNVMSDNIRKVWAYCRSLLGTEPRTRKDSEQMHLLLVNALMNLENNMRKAGWEVPSYEESRVRPKYAKGQDVITKDTPCPRCEYRKVDENGDSYCSIFRWNINASRYYVAEDDGCRRGRLKECYR